MAFLKTGPGMNIAEPSKLTTPFWLGAGMFATNSADHILQGLGLTGQQYECRWEQNLNLEGCLLLELPNLLLGRDLVPPKFLGEWSSMMFSFAYAVKITVSISSTKSRSFASFETSAPRMSLKAWRFLFLVSLLVWLEKQSAQVECVCMVCLITLRTTLLFDRVDWLLVRGKSKSKVEMRLRVSFLPLHSLNLSPYLNFWSASPPLSLSPLSASKQDSLVKSEELTTMPLTMPSSSSSPSLHNNNDDAAALSNYNLDPLLTSCQWH